MPDSIRAPKPHQHFAFGECASILARACGGTTGCSRHLGRWECGVGCRAEPWCHHSPLQGFSHVLVGAEQKVLPLWAVIVLCILPGSLDFSFCAAGANEKYFPYLNQLLETVQRAVIL